MSTPQQVLGSRRATSKTCNLTVVMESLKELYGDPTSEGDFEQEVSYYSASILPQVKSFAWEDKNALIILRIEKPPAPKSVYGYSLELVDKNTFQRVQDLVKQAELKKQRHSESMLKDYIAKIRDHIKPGLSATQLEKILGSLSKTSLFDSIDKPQWYFRGDDEVEPINTIYVYTQWIQEQRRKEDPAYKIKIGFSLPGINKLADMDIILNELKNHYGQSPTLTILDDSLGCPLKKEVWSWNYQDQEISLERCGFTNTLWLLNPELYQKRDLYRQEIEEARKIFKP